MPAKKRKKQTPEELCAEQKAAAWAALGQLMWAVSRPDYPPKTIKKEGDTENDHDDV